MNNIFIGLGIILGSMSYAQVGINTVTPKATLDITKTTNASLPEGFLTLRITGNDLAAKDNLYGADQNSTVVYATVVPNPSTSKTTNITSPGFYYYNHSMLKWVGLTMPKFFYMPSILFDTTTLGASSKDLYQLYLNQFTTPAVASTGSLGKIPVLGRNDLEYYVTYIDSTVFTNVTINSGGVINYTVSTNASENSFMNIVFVVK